MKLHGFAAPAFALAGLVLLSACDASSTKNVTDLVTQATNGWQVERSQNPMTDEGVFKAAKEFQDSGFTMKVEATCVNKTEFTYEITTFFTETGLGAPFKAFNGNVNAFDIRLDDIEPVTYVSILDYNNKITIPSDFRQKDTEYHVLFAELVTVALRLENGEPILKIDQTENGIRDVVAECRKEPEQPEPENVGEENEMAPHLGGMIDPPEDLMNSSPANESGGSNEMQR